MQSNSQRQRSSAITDLLLRSDVNWRARHQPVRMVEMLPELITTAGGYEPTIIYENERDKEERYNGTDALMPL